MKFKAYAKVNLTLEVLGVRPDGFHALKSVVLPIGLCDVLTFTPAESFSTDTGYSDDLILKAAKILASVQSPTSNLQPYAIRVEKRIPAGGGLGGGSADAAATLIMLNDLWHLSYRPQELAAIGAAVGSDVPALVLANRYGQPVLMEGRGEVVSVASGFKTPTPYLVLMNPGVHSSTPEVYAAFDRMRDRPEVRAARNQLEPPAVALHPEIGAALDTLRTAGLREVMMSGSGATVFGFSESREQSCRIVESLRADGYLAWVA